MPPGQPPYHSSAEAGAEADARCLVTTVIEMNEPRKRRGEAATPAKPASSDGGRGKGRVPAPALVAEPAMKLEQSDWIAMACLVVLCGFTRFWRLDKPPGKRNELACGMRKSLVHRVFQCGVDATSRRDLAA